MADNLTITEGGVETHMIFLLGRDLPNFALFDCLNDGDGRGKLKKMYSKYLKCMTNNEGCRMQLSAPTYKANANQMVSIMGYEPSDVVKYNKMAVEFMQDFRDEMCPNNSKKSLVVCADVGPKGDGYVPEEIMTVEEAKEFHTIQIAALAAAGIDFVSCLTMNYVEEAAGVALAAKDANLPVVISFVVETDGKLVHGMTLQKAIQKVEDLTGGYPTHYGINCAHPSHFASTLAEMNPAILKRVKQIRVNASKCSHAELDEATELDSGNIEELANEVADLASKYNLTTVGGCCGTDDRHIDAIIKKILSGKSK